MMRWCVPVLAFLLVGPRSEILANGAPVFPQQQRLPTQAARLIVVTDENARHATLKIPLAMVMQMQQQRPGVRGFGALGTPVIVAGLALSLAFVAGGFWLVRNRSGRRLAALLVGGSLFAFGAAALWADLGPRPNPRPGQPGFPVQPGNPFQPGFPNQPVQPVQPINLKNRIALPAGVHLTGDLSVEFLPFQGAPNNNIILVVPKNAVLQQGQQPGQE
jgi:hypothetical protein